jgi:putative ABC transport system substrate-binding protein
MPRASGREAGAHRLPGADYAERYAPRIEALKAGLGELGYVEGKNLTIEYRFLEDDRYERLPSTG